ncbi:MAG: carboxypeptidase-like regulatory domain-containing protein [Candidatus Cloacimonetes bacterium]|nr:carboxypeptidase-like regulatory domain-containing protein [Candidatus Cloacimonadota bacterium]
MKKFNLFVALMIIAFSFIFFGCEEDPAAPDEPGTVEGIITNANTGEAISGATINDGTADVATSETGGTYSFETDEGTYTFTCTAEGYNMQVMADVEVDAGETTTVDFQLQPVTVVLIENNIVGNTTWTNNNIYLIDGEILIQAVLTIEAGTRIKFKDSARFGVWGNSGGMIIAEGSTLLPIIFTSWHDDAHGGDTNGNGSASDPTRGDWNNIGIAGSNNQSSFDYCEIYYGGGYQDRYVMYLDSETNASVTNCTFAHNEGDYGALDASLADTGTIIQNNVFYDNTWPLNINCSYNIDDSNIFHDPSGRSDVNDHNGIQVNNMTVVGDLVWSETEVPFVFDGSEMSIALGTSLTLSPGVMIKLQNNDWWVRGTLIAAGTMSQPIWFTSYKDDTVGGDTNNDGSITSAGPGDWDYIKILEINNVSSFDYCKFYYGGGYSADYTLVLDSGTTVSVTNCAFVYNKGASQCVLNAWLADAGTNIAFNQFYNNEKPLRINGSLNLDSSNIFHNPESPTQNNLYNGIFVDNQGTSCNIAGNISWVETEVPFCALAQGINIDTGNSLTIAENVIFKFDGGSLDYMGDNLVNWDANGVWFTSYKDDEHGGDTNGDGDVTVPADGDWQGVYNWGGNPNFWEAWDNILYDDLH